MKRKWRYNIADVMSKSSLYSVVAMSIDISVPTSKPWPVPYHEITLYYKRWESDPSRTFNSKSVTIAQLLHTVDSAELYDFFSILIKSAFKSNQPLFIWRFSYRKVSQSALQRCTDSRKRETSNKIRRRKLKEPNPPTPTVMHRDIHKYIRTHTHTHTYAHRHNNTSMCFFSVFQLGKLSGCQIKVRHTSPVHLSRPAAQRSSTCCSSMTAASMKDFWIRSVSQCVCVCVCVLICVCILDIF